MKKAKVSGTVARSRIAPRQQKRSRRRGFTRRRREGTRPPPRRRHAFRDDELEKLVGKTITGDGVIAGNTFIVDDWAERKPK